MVELMMLFVNVWVQFWVVESSMGPIEQEVLNKHAK